MKPDEIMRLTRRMRRDPVFFCRHVLGVRPWQKQIEVLEALRDGDRVAVRSGHGVGKSFTAACAALWFLYSWYPAKVITTAPTATQVRQILWNEIRSLHNTARVPLGGKALEERIKLGDDAFAIGISTDEADRFQGYHAERILLILDEAPGVREEIWHAGETLLTGAVGKILAIGNPTRPSGLFYNAFRPGSRWTQLCISCLDSPNLREPGLPYPRLVTQRWLDDRRAEWGEDSPIWAARVLGEFPDDADGALVARSIIHRAADGLEWPLESAPLGAIRLGVDVAREGSDETVLLARAGERILHIERHRGWSTMETAGRVKALIDDGAVLPEQVYIDDTGVGGGVTDRLREQDLSVVAVTVGSRAEDPVHFANVRAEIFWRLRRHLMNDGGGRLRLPVHEPDLQGELAALGYAFTSTGAIKLDEKKSLRGKLGGSPNLADALALTYYEPRLTEACITVL